MPEEKEVKQLADVKAYLENRISEISRELEVLRVMVGWVDKALAEKSFRRVKAPFETEIPLERKIKLPQEFKITALETNSGKKLADLKVEDQSFRVTLVDNLSLEITLPPLESFLVKRVLEPMKKKSLKAVEEGEMKAEKIFSYQFKETNDILTEIIVTNYGGEKRLSELKSAIQWTLRKMYDKTDKN